jgi:hypothetical protein
VRVIVRVSVVVRMLVKMGVFLSLGVIVKVRVRMRVAVADPVERGPLAAQDAAKLLPEIADWVAHRLRYLDAWGYKPSRRYRLNAAMACTNDSP